MAAPRRRRTLRRRVLASTLAVATLATIGFGVPLGVVFTRMERERAILRLERQASEVLAHVPDEQLRIPGKLTLPQSLTQPSADTVIGVYAEGGRLLSGSGPTTSTLASAAATAATTRTGLESGQLAVAEPMRAEGGAADAVRVAVPASSVTEEQRETVLLMAGLAALVLVLASGAAFALSRRLARPLETLAANAHQLGDGDFTVRSPPSRTTEIDEVGQALDATAERLGTLVDRERAFTADASHQMRTPLTALRLGLETASYAPDATLEDTCSRALAEVTRLEQTVEHLLAIARDVDTPTTVVDVSTLTDEAAGRWEPLLVEAGRTLTVDLPAELPRVRVSRTGIGHVLDVLVDNAVVHGAGAVTVTARELGGAVAIDVADEGPGITLPPEELFRRRSDRAEGHGIGLALARSLAEADGGRLEVTRRAPHPRFTVVLPIARIGAPAVGAESGSFR